MQGRTSHPRNCERGSTLFFVAASLVALLAISALAIDLGIYYIVRNEAQRAADAAALAGAKKFVESGFITGQIFEAMAADLARTEAITVGGENLVGGEPALITDEDVSFDFSRPGNPLITVVVQRTEARGNPMPTFFARIMGFNTTNISGVATAEAYAPGGDGPLVGVGCLKPWFLSNCDPERTSPENPECLGGFAYYVTPEGEVANPGAIGQQIELKKGDPEGAVAPSQYQIIQIPPGEDPAICPACAMQETGSDGPGAALYRRNISCCNTNRVYCGQEIEFRRQMGDMVGPTGHGVACLIHQGGGQSGNPVCNNPNGCGQDYLVNRDSAPFPIRGGSNNPNQALRGQLITSSDSIVTVPLYGGKAPCPGQAGDCGLGTVVGFMSVFVDRVTNPQNTVHGTIMGISGCGGGGSGGEEGGGSGGEGGDPGGSDNIIRGPLGSPYPVRLVRTE
jgi:hypothetical protein